MTKIVGAFRALLINKNKQTKKLTVRKIYNHYLLSGTGVLKDPNPFSSLIDESHEKNFCMPWKLMEKEQLIRRSQILK